MKRNERLGTGHSDGLDPLEPLDVVAAESMDGRSFARNRETRGEGEDAVEPGVEVGIDVPGAEPGD